jgi:hypothetical protein
MKTRLYLSLTPESLVGSMLDPEEFGKYMSLGEERRNAGVVVFFEVDPAGLDPAHGLGGRLAHCVAHPDGRPKRSLYLSIYRALERVPVAALGDMFLTTKAGLTLRVARGVYQPQPQGGNYLYQEFAPVGVRAVSVYEPREFIRFITDPAQPVSLPRIAFADLRLGGLARDPAGGAADNLPYPDVDHLRKCLLALGKPGDPGGKPTKIVNRMNRLDDVFFMAEGGFHVGDAGDSAFYPMPDEDALGREHHAWWHSAKAYRGY